MPSKKLYAFVLDDDLRAALKRVKAEHGIGESEQIRRALRTWFRRRGVLKAERQRARTRQRS
jgi:hypothetical protein